MYDTQGGQRSLNSMGLPPLYHSRAWHAPPTYD